MQTLYQPKPKLIYTTEFLCLKRRHISTKDMSFSSSQQF